MRSKPPRDLHARIVYYLTRHLEGVSPGELWAWVGSVKKGAGAPWRVGEFERALVELRNAGLIAFTGGNHGVWWLR